MGGQRYRRNSMIGAGSAFVLGVLVGLAVKDAAQQLFNRIRISRWHREYERTEGYDENLPDSLERREPPPESGQPRYGGTGALGVHPAAGTVRP